MPSTPHWRRAVILHGYSAGPDNHWFRAVADELAATGSSVDIPSLPDSQNPDPDAWTDAALHAIGHPGPRDLVIAHSLGCITALRALSRFKGPWELGGLVLVAGFAEPLPDLPELSAFLDPPVDVAALSTHIAWRQVLRSDNDPVVPPAASQRLADALSAELTEVKGAGHFLGSGGYTTLPQLSALLASRSGRNIHKNL